MHTPALRRDLAAAVQALAKTSQPTIDHYEAVCKTLERVAAADFGIPVKVVLSADFSQLKDE